MKAFTTLGDGIAALKLAERPTPQPGDNQILVKMTAASLNSRDLLVVNGKGHWKPDAPRIPGSDGVGVVVAVGDAVSRFRTGDRVAGIFLPKRLDGELTAEKNVGALGGAATDGALAEYRVFDEQAVVSVPNHLTDVEAATLPDSAVTAWHAVLRRSHVQSGDRVLIQGTGGVSVFALQFVHALGGHAIVTSSSDQKLEKARALGAAARLRAIAPWSVLPDFASVNFAEDGAAPLAELLLARGVGVEAGLRDVRGAELFAASSLARRCLRVLLEAGERDAAAALHTVVRMEAVLEGVGVTRPRLLHGAGPSVWRLIDEAAARAYDTRFGFEDTLTLPDGSLAPNNAVLVAEARRRVTGALSAKRKGISERIEPGQPLQ